MDLTREETNLRRRVIRRVEAPSFGTVFFAGVQAGAVGYLTRGWTRGLVKSVLGSISDRLLASVRQLNAQLPTIQRELAPVAISPFQQLTYYGLTKASEPTQNANWQQYLPLQIAGQAIQRYQPRAQTALVASLLTPEQAERLALSGEQIATGFRRLGVNIRQQYRQRGFGAQIGQFREAFSAQFWRTSYEQAKEQLLRRYQQGVYTLLDLVVQSGKLSDEQLKVVAAEVFRDWRERASRYQSSELGQRYGLAQVTIQEAFASKQTRKFFTEHIRQRVTRKGLSEFRKRISQLGLEKEFEEFLRLPAGYGFYKSQWGNLVKATDVILLAGQRIRSLDVLIRTQRSIHIPYLSFNPLQLFVPPALEGRLFGETVRFMRQNDIVPTLFGTMAQGEAQTLEQLSQLHRYLDPNKFGRIVSLSRELNEILSDPRRWHEIPAGKIKSLYAEITQEMESFKLGISGELVVAGRQPVAVYKVQSMTGAIAEFTLQQPVEGQAKVRFMLKGYPVSPQQVGSGVFRQYNIMTGNTFSLGSDILFSQRTNLQPSFIQKLITGVQQIFTGQRPAQQLRQLQQQVSSANYDDSTVREILKTLGEQMKILKRSGAINTEGIDLSKYTEEQILSMVQELYGRYSGRHITYALFARNQAAQLEPSEAAIVRELESSQVRSIIDETWLAGTTRAGGRTRRQILQDVVFMYEVLTGQRRITPKAVPDEQLRTLLERFADLYSLTKRQASKQEDVEAIERLTQFIGKPEILEHFAKLVRKETAGFRQLFEPDHALNKMYLTVNQYMFIPTSLTTDELRGLGFELGWLEQLFPGTFRLASQISAERGLVTEVGVMATHFAYRPVELMETLGLGGIDQSKVRNQLEIVQRIFTRKIVPAMIGLGAIAGLDALFGLGTAGWGLLNNLYVGGAQLADITGIGPLARYIHTHQPSLLAAAGQAFGLYAVGDVGAQFLLGQLGAYLEQIPTAKEQQLQQEGVGLVEKRKAAGWEFGRGPYWGSKAQYYRPFLPYLNEREWMFSENVYASKWEYLAFGFPFPTPFNLFGLTWVIDPYHYERKLWAYRPYPISGPAPFTEIPLIGPLLTPLSYLIKPPLNLAELSQQQMVQSQAGTYGFNYMAIQREYLQSGGMGQFDITPGTYSHIPLTKQISDYLGIVGFQTTQFTGEQLAGEGEYYKPKLQHSGMQLSAERMYYMAKLGNVFGLSEFIRRMIPHDEAGYPQFNPLVNAYLSQFEWLPERYKVGDQYQSMDFGEVRLPGPQYEKTRIMIDRYGPVDQFLILQNVQPYSVEYERAKQRILADLQANPARYSELTRFLIQQQIENAEKLRQGLDVYQKVYTQGYETITLQLGRYLGSGMFEVPGKSYLVRIQGVITDEQKLAYEIYRRRDVSLEEQFGIQRQLMQNLDQQFRQMENQAVALRVFKDQMQRFTYTESGELILEAGQPHLDVPASARRYDHPLAYQTHGFNLLRAFWDVAGYFVPETFAFEKFFQYRDPMEQYMRYQVYGKQRMLWHRVLSDIIFPNLNIIRSQNLISAIIGGATTGWLSAADSATRLMTSIAGGLLYGVTSLLPDWIPPSTQARWRFEQEMDQLVQQQDEARASRNRSVLGIRTVQGYGSLQRNVPLEYKPFIPFFANAPSYELGEIAHAVPGHIRQVLDQVWNAKIQAIQRQERGQSLNFRTAVENQVGEVDIEDELEEIGGFLPYIDLRAYRAMSQLARFADVSQMSVTPQIVYQAHVSMLDQNYLNRRSNTSIAQFNSEYMRQLRESQRYAGSARVVLSQSRQQTAYNYHVRR